jgi:dihydrofolate synthase/folylpolyglutamate synthase
LWDFEPDLKGAYQEKNLAGVCTVLIHLRRLGFKLRADRIRIGLEHTIKNTALKGRWQKLNDLPLTICDTGHNEHAFRVLVEELKAWNPDDCHFILGFSQDKDLTKTLGLLPKTSNYYFVPFQSPRAAAVEHLISFANNNNITNVIPLANVNEAIQHVKKLARKEDFIYIGGSTYLVAEIKDL